MVTGSFGRHFDSRLKNSVSHRFPLRMSRHMERALTPVFVETSSPSVGKYFVRRSLSESGVRFAQSRRSRRLFPVFSEETPGAVYDVVKSSLVKGFGFPRSTRKLPLSFCEGS